MADWHDYEKDSTEDLIEIIKWKDEEAYKNEAEAAFFAFCFRFRKDVINKCEIICENWGYDIEFAGYLANKVFEKFWKYPKYDDKKRNKAKDFDSGVRYYLYAIAKRELTTLYNKEKGIKGNPGTGEEHVIYNFPDLEDFDFKPENKKELEERYEIIKSALSRLTEKHKIIYLTYSTYSEFEKEGHNLPTHLLESLRNELALTQSTIRFYKKEAFDKVNEYLEIYGNK